MTDEQITTGRVPLRVAVGVEGDWLIQRVAAHDGETVPSAVVTIAVNPDAPNSYDEFMTLMNIFTDEFTAEVSRVMGVLVMQAAEENPEALPEVREAVIETMEMQGFSRAEAEEITDESTIL